MRIEDLYSLFCAYPKVVKDTRLNVEDSIYFSLKGGNFDGNVYASDALDKGAAYAVIDDEKFKSDDRMILVDDALKALQHLATYHRRKLGVPILALTGSNGKTTTKELIYGVLRQKYRCWATQGNYNNHIGVPLTLLQMDESTEIGVVEMGANNPGEIAALCDIAYPDYGYITNFGRVHLEGFGSLQGVIEGKTEMYRHLAAHDKTVFVNAPDPVQMERTASMKRYVIGNVKESGTNDPGCNVRFIDADPFVRMEFEGREIRSDLIGAYNYQNMAAAACIGKYFEVDIENIAKGIESYRPSNNRSQVIQRGSNTIILDAYNANPNSMEAAIANLKGLGAKKKVAVLGDMFEVGADSAMEHQKIAELIVSTNVDAIYLIGENFAEVDLESDRVEFFPKYEGFVDHFAALDFENTTFLIKASRGMALERVLEFL
jgi:UDP-N-acetylmuramoyl-tripeptide--D-alanyl-D-alanine ligase